MRTTPEVKTGLYKFKSPYHKNTQIPFFVLNQNLVKTVEYKGYTAYSVFSFYDDVQKTIDHCKMEFVCGIQDVEFKQIIEKDKIVIALMNKLIKAKN